MEKQGDGLAKGLYEWVQPLVYAAVIVVTVFTFAAGRFSVNQSSMTNTLTEGETVIVSRLPYTPGRGDIVIFTQYGEQTYIKRVVGLPGDLMEYRDGKLYINDTEQDEPYIREKDWRWHGDMPASFTVPEGHVFVMGDNRNGSKDSRDSRIGFVDRRTILGRVLLRITPFSRFGPVA